MDAKLFIALMAIAGLAVGLAGYGVTQNGGNSYCLNLEKQIQQNQSFNGSIACRPPGVFGVNMSRDLENRTALKCVCRKSYDGQEQYIAVTVPK